MSKTAVVHTELAGSEEAGTALGRQIREELQGEQPDALILFASPKYDHSQLLRSLDAACHPKLLVGCSSAGEFTSDTPKESTACSIALRSRDMRFASGLGRRLRSDRAKAAGDLVASFTGRNSQDYSYRSAMILTDALAGSADELIEQVTVLTAGTYQFFGGGAGDDANFGRTHVFHGTEVVHDAAVALEILSNKPLGIGVCHGWGPASPPMRVTEADGVRLISLDAATAVDVFREHARLTGQQFDPAGPLPFFLHNVLGIRSGADYKLRVPLQVESDGSVICAAEVPAGSTVSIMKATGASAAEAATEATRRAISKLDGHAPKVAIFFDCVATRLRTGRDFGFELAALQQELGAARFAGCNSYGQIARAEGQFGGFHNCTAVIGVLSD